MRGSGYLVPFLLVGPLVVSALVVVVVPLLVLVVVPPVLLIALSIPCPSLAPSVPFRLIATLFPPMSLLMSLSSPLHLAVRVLTFVSRIPCRLLFKRSKLVTTFSS